MATPKFQSPFPPMELGYEDKKELCRICKRALDEVVEGYERFVWQDQGVLSPSRWFIVKARDDVRVYHDRRTKTENDPRDVETLLAIGTVVGNLDDAMYGVVNHTTNAMRLKAAYMQDSGIANCAVLATVQEPKYDKPFRSMTVKWLVKTIPLAMRAMMKQRDMVFVEATGTKRLSTGERIGFQLVHSIDHLPQARALPMYYRTTISSCSIWRQQSPDHVEVYTKSFIDAPERVLAPVIVRSAADSMVSVWRHMHCSQMKKLTWLLELHMPESQPGDKKSDQPPSSGRCSVCTAKSKTTCAVCSKNVCSNCRVKRDLFSIDAGTDELREKPVVFCVPCLTVAVRTGAADLARDHVPAHKMTSSRPRSARSGKSDQSYSRRQSASSSTSSERSQDTYSCSRTSSKPSVMY